MKMQNRITQYLFVTAAFRELHTPTCVVSFGGSMMRSLVFLNVVRNSAAAMMPKSTKVITQDRWPPPSASTRGMVETVTRRMTAVEANMRVAYCLEGWWT